jgi:large subunit ribosomal protein LX
LAEVRTFRITGEVKKPRTTIPFALELRATKEEDAIETVYTDMGSRHKARRLDIKLEKVEELKTAETGTEQSGK